MIMTEAIPTHNDEIEDLDVILVGAGFAGFYLLDRLRGMGMSVQVFEAGDGPGGVWYWNCYPGARVTSPAPMYQFSRDDLWRDWKFSELIPRGRKSASISTMWTKNSTSVATFVSTDA
jgi:cation diffusion facilitator CzcD-associated flavoprotein CzcO